MRRILIATLAVVALIAGQSAMAADQTWYGDGVTAGGIWDAGSLTWDGGTAAWSDGNTAVFGPTAAGTVDMAAPINVAGMTFGADGYTVMATDPLNVLTFAPGSIIDVQGANTAIVNSIITGSDAFTKNGTGTLVLGGVNTVIGTFTLNEGTLALGNSTALGGFTDNSTVPATYTRSTLVINGGTLATIGGNRGLANNGPILQINESFVFAAHGTGNYMSLGGGGVTFAKSVTIDTQMGALTLQTATGSITAPAGTVITKAGPGHMNVMNLLDDNSPHFNVTEGSFGLGGASASPATYNTFTSLPFTMAPGTILSLSGGDAALGTSPLGNISALTFDGSYSLDNVNTGPSVLGNNPSITLSGNLVFGDSRTHTGTHGTLNMGTGNVTITDNRTITVGFYTTEGTPNLTGGLTIGGVIDDGAETYGLTKEGPGILVLGGENTFGGPLTVNDGTVSYASPLALGPTQKATLGAAGSLRYTGTADYTPSTIGTGLNFTHAGTGVVTLSEANKFTGTVAVNTSAGGATLTLSAPNNLTTAQMAGGSSTVFNYLNINHADALGTTGTLQVSSANARLDNTSGSALTLNGTHNVTVGANLVFSGTSDLNLGEGTATLTNNRTITVSGGTLTLDNIAPDATLTRTLTKSGVGTLVIAGDTTHTGTTTVSGGKLVLQGAMTGNMTINAATVDLYGTVNGNVNVNNAAAVLNLYGSDALGSGTNTLQISNAAGRINNASGAHLSLEGTHNVLVNANLTYTGPNDLNLGAGSMVFNGNRTITVDAGTLTIGGGVITDATLTRTLTKAGDGTFVLAGTSSYTGNTTVNAGKLLLTGIIPGSATVAATGILSGTGLIGTNATINGGFEADLGISGNLAITGSLTLHATSSVLTLTGTPGKYDDYTLASFASLTGTFASVYFGGTLVTDPLAIGGTHSLVYNADSIQLIALEEAPAFLPGDCNKDKFIDGGDLATLGLNWSPGGTGKTWEQGDFNGDGAVDGGDLASLGLNWAPGGYTVPEPATIALLSIGGLALIRRRK